MKEEEEEEEEEEAGDENVNIPPTCLIAWVSTCLNGGSTSTTAKKSIVEHSRIRQNKHSEGKLVF